jgi:hypothetical protein
MKGPVADIHVLPQSVFRPSATSPREVSISEEALRLLALIDGVRTIEQIAQSLNMSPAFVVQTAGELYRLGLLTIENQSNVPMAKVNPVFFETLEQEFVKIIGPMGPLLVDEEIANLGESVVGFPQEKLAALIERVSALVVDEKKRVNFLRLMLGEMRKLQSG